MSIAIVYNEPEPVVLARHWLMRSQAADSPPVLEDRAEAGVVTQVERAGRVQGRAQLAFVFTQLQADNLREDVQTAPLTYVAESSKGTDAAKIGAGAIGGAIIGGILGGGSGAARGAAIGGAAGTGVVLATRGSEVTLEKGTVLAASLTTPLTLRVTAR